jgi:hypothetical protein
MEVVIERIGAAFGLETKDLLARQADTAIVIAVVDHVLLVTVGRILGGESEDPPWWNTDRPFFRSRRSAASLGGLGIPAHWLACPQVPAAGNKARSTPRTADAAPEW